MAGLSEELMKYRDDLLSTLRFLNESYDKILVTLAGGALGLSIAFLKDVIDLESVVYPQFLLAAWFAFILSLATVLGRIFFGIEAYRRAIRQLDDGTIYENRPGGPSAIITRALHALSAVFLLVGLISIATFSYLNVGD